MVRCTPGDGRPRFLAGMARKMVLGVGTGVGFAFAIYVGAYAAQVDQPTGLVSEKDVVDPGGERRPDIAVSIKKVRDRKIKEMAGMSSASVKGKAWDTISFASRSLFNNVWGKAPGETLTSEIFVRPDGGFGWLWDRPQPGMKPGHSLVHPIYPNVTVGGSPWVASKIPNFPVKVKDVTSAVYTVSYDFGENPVGRYNLAYDMFLSDTQRASRTPRPKAEVMIWVRGSAGQPEDKYKGEVGDGINIYRFYSWTMAQDRRYYAFVQKNDPGPRATHRVNVKKLLDTIAVGPDWYIPGVELGTEVWDGSGEIEIRGFRININGFDL